MRLATAHLHCLTLDFLPLQSLSLQTTLWLLTSFVTYGVSAIHSWNADISSHTTVHKFPGGSICSVHSVPFRSIPFRVLQIPGITLHSQAVQ